MKSALFSHQYSHSFSQNPILIIDRDGLIGEPLSLKLSKEFLVIFVSRSPSANVTFSRKFPVIPDNKYSHIIFIDEEGRDIEFLPKIIEKVKDVNSDFIAAFGLTQKGEYAAGKILRSYSGTKIVLFGDIFDNKLILRKENFKSVINKFIYQAQKFGKMQVLGEGLRETYPVFLDDVIDGLIELVFKMHKSHSLFYIFPKHPPTELSLVHMIQKINPEVTIDFIRHDPRLGKISYPPNGKNLLGDKYALAKKIRSIDIEKKVKAQDEGFDHGAKKLRSFPFFVVWILIFLLFSPFIFTSFFSFLGLGTFHYAKGEINKGNIINTKSSLHLSQTFYYVAKQAANVLSLQAKILGQKNNFKSLIEDIDISYKISEGLFQAFNSGAYFSKIFKGESKNPADDFARGESYLKSSIVVLNDIKAEAHSAGRRSPKGDSGQEKISAVILQNLEIVNPLIKLLSNISDIMPSIFGMEEPKTYLILFQNNMEIRPGGGVIDSYGILKFNLGKIMEFTMHGISEADLQLRGHVEPPFALRRYLPEQHWRMKDSNFDVDFSKSASASSNFFFVETGQKVDGVVGIDSSLRAKLAGAKSPSLALAQTISDALLQKHLLLTFNDSQNIFTVNGWSSSLWDERKKSEDSINDFVGINEANLGMNKVNYFIKRQVSQIVTIGNDGNISEELTINIKNESKVWPGGDYKNYLRIILPENIKLSEISINDKSQNIIDAITDPAIYEAKNFKAPQGLEVEKTQEDNKTIFGFLVKVPAGELVRIKLKYTLAGSIFGLSTFSYNLKFFKQPGIDSIPYSFSFIYPNFFNIVKSSDKVSDGKGSASYSERIVGDKNLIINFAKNKSRTETVRDK